LDLTRLINGAVKILEKGIIITTPKEKSSLSDHGIGIGHIEGHYKWNGKYWEALPILTIFPKSAIKCWICGQPFIHKKRGPKPDACPECRKNHSDKQYQKFRSLHKLKQFHIETDLSNSNNDILNGISSLEQDGKEFDEEESGDYDLFEHENSYSESGNIDKKEKYVYVSYRNQHGQTKKSHYEQLFKDSINPSPMLHKKANKDIYTGLKIRTKSKLITLNKNNEPINPVKIKSKCWISQFNKTLPNRYTNWDNFSPKDPKSVPLCNNVKFRLLNKKRDPIEIPEIQDISIYNISDYYRLGHERIGSWAKHDLEHKKYDKNKHPERVKENAKFSKRPSRPYYWIGSDIPKKHRGTLINIPNNGSYYLYSKNEQKMREYFTAINGKKYKKDDNVFDPYFRTSHKFKGQEYNGGPFKIYKKYKDLPGWITSEVNIGKSVYKLDKVAKEKRIELMANKYRCPICGYTKKKRIYTKIEFKYPGEKEICSKCGYVIKGTYINGCYNEYIDSSKNYDRKLIPTPIV
jgi:ribosomal protein L37AE/L43A